MNMTFSEADDLVSAIMDKLEQVTLDANTQMIICPPFPYLEMVSDFGDESYFSVGAQNVSDQEGGAYTGEVSAAMLESMELDYCIVGHSERRAYYHETDAIVAAKVKRQITDGLFHLTAEEFADVIIAYEPVWAIGTGKTATPDQAEEMHAFIRSLIAEHYGQEVADNTSILYGGSCKPSNAKELFAQPDVDGGLIGGASLKADDFVAIAQAF